ncbi:uncharacterized protein LOC110674832 [Aedes aegypti]|uniref:Putative 14.5 kDa salivary protein n=1 Tax=Aedes aegypti TaxID=7159 RepID=Q1HRF3_AEDAE|nr:uncharacterized protein LOC110674832 [Aedes aegypti]ABF18174.1 putative 14.5 kDa salivary protein [Aedes aegypti]
MSSTMSPFDLIIVLLALPIILVNCYPRPDEDPSKKCEDELVKLKAAISTVSSSQPVNNDLLPNLTKCPKLIMTSAMLKAVAHGMMALKDRGVTNMEAQLLRESFEEKLNDIAKNKEIFDQTQGQMAEKINKLQAELTKVQKEIREQTLLIKH